LFIFFPANRKDVNVTGDNVAFVYPDMRTAMKGKFKSNVMVSARATRITQIR
jgi:hypothetical protein